MKIVDLLSNILIGILTGLISGYLVSFYYREKDKNEQLARLLQDNKQNMSNFLNLVKNELNEIVKNPNDFLESDLTDFRNFLITAPRFDSFEDLSKIPEEHQNSTKRIYTLLEEIKNCLEENNLDRAKLMNLRISLLRAQYEMLKIDLKKKH